MSGATSVRVASNYYGLVLEDTIRYDFEVQSDALDYSNTEEEEYITKLQCLTPQLDALIEALGLGGNKCLLTYQEESFLFPDTTSPYYSDLIERGGLPVGKLCDIPMKSQKPIVIKGIVLPFGHGAGKYLNLELVVAAEIIAGDIAKIIDKLESTVAEQWPGESYHVLNRS